MPLGLAGERARLAHDRRRTGPVAVIAWAVTASFGAAVIPLPDEATRTASIGEMMFTNWVIPFEVVSFVLLAALIGGIALARQDAPEEGEA